MVDASCQESGHQLYLIIMHRSIRNWINCIRSSAYIESNELCYSISLTPVHTDSNTVVRLVSYTDYSKLDAHLDHKSHLITQESKNILLKLSASTLCCGKGM